MPRRRPDPIATALRRGFGQMARGGLRGVWVRGEVPDGPFVWAATHHSWWDPFLASVILDRHDRLPALIMLQDNLRAYGFLRRLGVFGTAEHRRGLGYLADGRALIVFPEGELRPVGPVGPLADGAAWYARRAGVPLCAVATRILMRGHQAPEAYLSLASIEHPGSVRDLTRHLADTLDTQLTALDTLTATSDPRSPLPGYRLIVRGRRSWDERIDAMSRWRRPR